MNGRLYDPVLHRFLAPDNYIQDPFNTQNFNRYGYVLNNPLMYTDPSGEFFWIAVGIGAALGAFSQAIKPGATFGSILGGALVGGLAGAVGGGITNLAAGGTFFGSQVATTIGFWAGASSGAMGGLAGGFVGGAGIAWVNGANFGEGLGAGAKAGAIGAFTGGLINGISSGINAVKNNREFWSGQEWNEITIGHGGQETTFAEVSETLKKWDQELSMNIKSYQQKGMWDCSHACKLSVDDYFGVTGQNNINSKWLSMANAKSVNNGNTMSLYQAAGYQVNSSGSGITHTFTAKTSLTWMNNEMSANRIVQIAWKPTGTFGHASLVTKIRYLSDFSKYGLQIMNPASGSMNWMSKSQIKSIHQIFSIWR